MSYAARSTHNISNPNTTGTSNSLLRHHPQSQSQSHLQARIAAKRAELENLRQLRDHSATLATQLTQLEAKLGTLRDGAQSVALVLTNWDNVLRAIAMAAVNVPRPPEQSEDVAGDEDMDPADKEKKDASSTTPELPVPLVRIPVQQTTDQGG